MANETSKPVIDHVDFKTSKRLFDPNLKVEYSFYTADGELVSDMDVIREYMATHYEKDNYRYGEELYNQGGIDVQIKLKDPNDTLGGKLFHDGQQNYVIGGNFYESLDKIAAGEPLDLPFEKDIPPVEEPAVEEPVVPATPSVTTPIASVGGEDDYRFWSIAKLRSFSPAAYSEDQLRKLLYTKYINPANETTFATFVDNAKAQADVVIKYKDSIRTILQATNSEAFYSGSTAIANIRKLDAIGEDIDKFKNDLATLTPETIGAEIAEYNENLKNAKIETRKYITKNVANDINPAEQLYKDNGITEIQTTTPMPPEEYEQLKPYVRKKIVYTLIRKVKNNETGVITYTYKKDDKDYFYIEEINDDYKSMEDVKILPAEDEGESVHLLPYVPSEVEALEGQYEN